MGLSRRKEESVATFVMHQKEKKSGDLLEDLLRDHFSLRPDFIFPPIFLKEGEREEKVEKKK